MVLGLSFFEMSSTVGLRNKNSDISKSNCSLSSSSSSGGGLRSFRPHVNSPTCSIGAFIEW